MKKQSTDSLCYRINWLAALLASHADYESLSSEENGFLLTKGRTRKHVSYLNIGTGIAIESGYFWDVLAIHLENGTIIRMGGINKKKSRRLQAALNQVIHTYLAAFYQRLVPDIKKASQQAKLLFSGNRYIRQTVARQWLEAYQDLHNNFQRKAIQRFLPADVFSDWQYIQSLLDPELSAITELNKAYVEHQLAVFQAFFDGVESNPLTANQRRACVIDEQHNLVLAGAGTGKTSTMIGRAGYLIKAGLAKPEQILMLAFARKAAEEMDERIRSKLGIETLTVKTFHSLGKHIIAQVEGTVPAIDKMAEDEHLQARFVDEQLQRLLQDEQYKSRLTAYFLYYSYPYRSAFKFKSLGEYNQYILENDIRTLQGELVKSYEECEIANFLYRQGIAYKYEANYQVNTAGPDYRVYQPDFYLPDYGIYIEHFAVNERNQTPPFIDQKSYLEGMVWKRGGFVALISFKQCLAAITAY